MKIEKTHTSGFSVGFEKIGVNFCESEKRERIYDY